MRSSFCESYCAPFNCLRSLFCCCLPSSVQTKDAPDLASIPTLNSNSNPNSSANPVPIEDSGAVSASIEEKSSEEKVGSVSVSVEEVSRKSCLKQPNGERRGNVKWMDFLGKELVEIQEYEPSESDSLEDDDGHVHCICSLQ